MQTDAIYKRRYDESSGRQQTNGCPECDGRVNTTSHESVCGDCGLVLAESAVDRGPEWRSFESQDGDLEARRTGAPLTPTRHDEGLSTEIGQTVNGRGKGPAGRERRRLGRLRREHQRTKRSSKRERNQMEGLFEIDRIRSALGLPDTVGEQASVLFKSAHDAGLLPGRSIEAMATASVYAACRCSAVPRLLDEFVHVSSVDESSVVNAYDVLNRELGLPTPPPAPGAYLPAFAPELDLGSDIERRARRLVTDAEEHGIANGRNPAGVAAACLLVAAREVGCRTHPTQQALADVAGVVAPTIRKRRDELRSVQEQPPV